MRRKLDSRFPFDIPKGAAIYRSECEKLPIKPEARKVATYGIIVIAISYQARPTVYFYGRSIVRSIPSAGWAIERYVAL